MAVLEQRRETIAANGLDFAYVEAGDGPLVLLLHGFPDSPHTWSDQLEALAAAGYRAVAPFMRGYGPTGPAPDGRYDPVALAADVAGLVEALGDGPARVVGNDWGGIATYAAMALHPEAIERAAVINIGHPATFPPTLLDPAQVHHIFHFWFFQLGDVAAGAVRANDMALVDYLWRYWSTAGHDDHEHVARVKEEALAPEGSLEAALSYYPGLLNLPSTDAEAAERLQGDIAVPTLAIFGAEDPPRLLSENEHVHFASEYRLEIVPAAGHFVHREQPEVVNRLLLDWFSPEKEDPR
jgi:pimeloyl-ACP methyl ester carboxylesterase